MINEINCLTVGIKKGFLAMCDQGFQTGQRIAGVQFTLLDGDHHIVDSSEFCKFIIFLSSLIRYFLYFEYIRLLSLYSAFFQAAQGAVRDCFESGRWGILEPIMLAEVDGPAIYMPAILGDLRKRSGILVDEETSGDWAVAQVEVPLNNMFGYIDYLR